MDSEVVGLGGSRDRACRRRAMSPWHQRITAGRPIGNEKTLILEGDQETTTPTVIRSHDETQPYLGASASHWGGDQETDESQMPSDALPT